MGWSSKYGLISQLDDSKSSQKNWWWANEKWITTFPAKWRANGQQGGSWAPTRYGLLRVPGHTSKGDSWVYPWQCTHGMCCVLYRFLGIITHKYPLHMVFVGISRRGALVGVHPTIPWYLVANMVELVTIVIVSWVMFKPILGIVQPTYRGETL